MNLSTAKILITGGSGFLGSHLSRRLTEEGAEVHAVSRKPRDPESGSMRWWQGDMAEITSVREIFNAVRPDVVFHLSGLATASPDRHLILPTLHSLLVSTVNVLTVGAETACRTVLAASLTEPQQSQPDIVPGSPYAAAKWASGAYARMFHKLYDMPVVMVRPFMTYGPGQDERKLIPHVIHSLLSDEPPRLSSGSQQIDWVYIDDVTEGFVAAAQAPNVEGETIDLGSGVLVTIRSVVEYLVKVINPEIAPAFGALPDRPLEHARKADVLGAQKKLGWKAATPLKTGLRYTTEWYRRRHLQSLTADG